VPPEDDDPLVDDEPPLSDPPVELPPEPLPDDSPFVESFAESVFADLSAAPSDPLPAVAPSRAALRDAAPRSFFAQPLPLKWNVGGAKAFRTGDAPQIGQTLGPSAVTEWMTSNRCPFGQR
jgi:hypothetical protein